MESVDIVKQAAERLTDVVTENDGLKKQVEWLTKQLDEYRRRDRQRGHYDY